MINSIFAFIRKRLQLPVSLVMLFALAMLLLGFSNLGPALPIPFRSWIALAILFTGLTLIGMGGYGFRRANTTISPVNPEQATQLVTAGIYRFSRNPMYVGFFLWLAACAVAIGALINLLLLPVFIVLVNRLYITPEEQALEALFGDQFSRYKKKVRRWL